MYKNIILAIFYFFACTSLHAELIHKDDYLIVTNFLKIEDYQKFENLIYQKNIKKVIFKNCEGGDALAGLKYGKLIQFKKITTIASGEVLSSCAYAFLGGTIRKFDLENNSILGFHGLFHKNTKSPVTFELNNKFLDFLYKNINFEFSTEIKNIILKTKNIYEGVYFYNELHKNMNFVMYCNGILPIDLNNCKQLKSLSAISEKIITE